jgi:hypothetical protein
MASFDLQVWTRIGAMNRVCEVRRGPVAQISNLPYRGFPTRRGCLVADGLPRKLSGRYGRLETCATKPRFMRGFHEFALARWGHEPDVKTITQLRNCVIVFS